MEHVKLDYCSAEKVAFNSASFLRERHKTANAAKYSSGVHLTNSNCATMTGLSHSWLGYG